MSDNETCRDCGQPGHFACGETECPGGYGRWKATKLTQEQQSALGQQQAAQGLPEVRRCFGACHFVATNQDSLRCDKCGASMCTENMKALGLGHVGSLRARVAELEADLNAARSVASHIGCMATIDTLKEDLRRKREECDRLEQVCSDLRDCVARYRARWEGACKDLADARAELRRGKR